MDQWRHPEARGLSPARHREVWFWKDDAITFPVLVGDAYEKRTTSALGPALDCQLADELLELPSLSAVKRALGERLS